MPAHTTLVCDGIPMDVIGRFIRILVVRAGEEHFYDVINPGHFVKQFGGRCGIADLLAFSQRLPDTAPRFRYYFEWDNVAALPITNYEHWESTQIQTSTRKHIRRAARRGTT